MNHVVVDKGQEITPTVFFSHSMTTYSSAVEERCLITIKKMFPKYRIINPRDVPLNAEWDFDACMTHLLPLVHNSKAVAWYKDDSYSPGVDIEIAEATRLGIVVVKVEA